MNLIAKIYLATLEDNYKRKKNPRYVWRAINVVCSWRGELPEWIRAYLFETSLLMLEESKKTGTKDSDIVANLGFKDLRQLNDPELIGAGELKVMQLMHEKVEKQGMTQGEAAKQIEQEVNKGLKKGQVGYWGESKIQKKWKKWKEGLLKYGYKEST